jgi:hypothetical protein
MIFRASAVVALFTGLAFVPAAAASAGPRCGDTISGDVTLTRDLTCTGDGLHFVSPKSGSGAFKLNLAGHTLKGNGTGNGIAADNDQLSIVNGTITGFSTTIKGHAHSIALTRVKISKTSWWLALRGVTNVSVVDSRFVDAGSGGATSDAYLKVNNSEFVRTNIKSASEGDTYVYNSHFTEGNVSATFLYASGNVINSCPAGQAVGIQVDGMNMGLARITGNTVHGCMAGIEVVAPIKPTTIEGNLVSGTGTGIVYSLNSTFAKIEITGNVLTKNSEGLTGWGDGPTTITANSTSKNTNAGITVSGADIIDGGGNTATDNGAVPACIGVVCE